MLQTQTGNQADGPDDIIVNEQEQEKEVNLEDEAFEGNAEEKAYSEGNMNNSDTAAKPSTQDSPLENLPGTQADAEDASPESTDLE